MKSAKKHQQKMILVTGMLILLAACNSTPKTNPAVVAALVEEGKVPARRSPNLDVEVIRTVLPAQAAEYRIGPGDVLNVAVLGHPEFNAVTKSTAGEVVGVRVQPDGKLYLPMVAGIQAAGKTTGELRGLLAAALAKYVKQPQVSVDILTYASQKFYVLGQVQQPGVFPVDGNTTLLEGIARAGGIRESGDIDGAYVIRAGKLLPVSLGDILLRGDTTRNVTMQQGDMVYVPDKTDWKVYVLGEVKQPGIVPMGDRGLNLADALAYAQGIDPLNADRGVIRIFRGTWRRPRDYTLSTEDVYRFGTSIRLTPGDRIIVAPRGLASWNRTLTLMLPFINTAMAASTAAVAARR